MLACSFHKTASMHFHYFCQSPYMRRIFLFYVYCNILIIFMSICNWLSYLKKDFFFYYFTVNFSPICIRQLIRVTVSHPSLQMKGRKREAFIFSNSCHLTPNLPRSEVLLSLMYPTHSVSLHFIQ